MIAHHHMLAFGVGIGGSGGPQRIYAPDNFNPADNLFILMYASFGAFAILYLIGVCFLVLRPVTGSEAKATTGTALLAFGELMALENGNDRPGPDRSHRPSQR
jgi:hypothetical protein